MRRRRTKKYMWTLLMVCCLTIAGIHFRQQIGILWKGIAEKLEEESLPEEEIDFAHWQERNPDVYAWIRVPGTKIDYPVLQNETEAEDYYLTHDIDRESNIYGAIYTENKNSKTFTDPNTVIYGHNMNDGSMFGSLKAFIDPDFFAGNEEIVIYLPGETLRYRIVAAYRYPAVHLLDTIDLSTEENIETYYQAIPELARDAGGNLRGDAEIQGPLLTLSTCTADDDSKRYLVQAILTGRKKIEQ